MKNKENKSTKNDGFLQGWGFIILIITGVTLVLIGIKILIN
jgi:hypothetical protein